MVKLPDSHCFPKSRLSSKYCFPMKKNCPDSHNNHRSFLKSGILLSLAVIFIFLFLYSRGMNTARWGMSECLKWQGTSLSERFILKEQDAKKLNSLLEVFSHKVESGNISPGRGFSILRAFYKGPLLLALLNSSVKNKLQTFDLVPRSEIAELEKISNLFFRGVKSGKIAEKEWKRVKKSLMEESFRKTHTSIGSVLPESIETFKKGIRQDALFNCLGLMNKINKLVELVENNESMEPVEELEETISQAIDC